jgi:hypothetical protein
VQAMTVVWLALAGYTLMACWILLGAVLGVD